MSQKRILIIDDDTDLLTVVEMTLTLTASWSVLSASSGADGIELAKTEQPDVILLDMMMPEMDGLTTLKHLQANPNTQNIPVIILTAKVQEYDFPHLYQAGVAGALAKPYDSLTLASQIAEFLGWPSPT